MLEKLILVDPNPGVCTSFERYFADLPNVEVREGYFEQLREYDCFVSAANSFGLMDGGVDAAIIRFFGDQLMRRVQERIIDEYFGEQPVGTSMIVETGAARFPYIAHTPTMRVPMAISRTDHVYLAMWAMLRAVHQHNLVEAKKIAIVACPGLGTGTGKVTPNEAARQMALAYRNYLNPPPYINWGFASERQANVRYGGDLSFHFPNA